MHRPSIVALLVLICFAAATHAQHAGSSAGSSWTAPRTPWGDPDLQGNYTNSYRRARRSSGPRNSRDDASRTSPHRKWRRRSPSARRTRSREPSSSAATRKAKSATRPSSATSTRSPRAAGLGSSSTRRTAKSRRSSRQPAPASPRAAHRQLRQRTIQQPRRFQPVGSLHHTRHAGLDAAGPVRQLLSDRARAGLRGHPLRDGPRHASHPARQPSTRRRADSIGHGCAARPLGRQHTRRRDDELQGAQRISQRQRRHAENRRALHAHGGRQDRVASHHRRSHQPGRGRGRSRFR